jgi:hypothetical protein
LLLGVLLCAAYPDVVFGRNTFYFRDFGYFGYPLAHYHRESFWHGEIPLWNPLSYCGLPFLAQWNTLVLYPGSAIYLLLPVSWSLGLYGLAHLVLAGVGMHTLASRWTGNRIAGAIAGIAFGLNGLSLNSLMWPNNVAALGWMPWVVLAAERGWREGGGRLAIAAGVGALQMLTGAPEIILFTWAIVAVVAAVDFASGAAPRARLAVAFPVLVLLVTGLAAAQLLPFLELLRASQRDQQFGNTDWAMLETGWANYLVPLFRTFKNRQGVHFQYGQYWTSSYYLGVCVFALAVFGALRVRGPRAVLATGIAIAGLVLALGDLGYVYTWVRKLFPQLGFMRFPIKFVVLTTFAIPLLAAFGARYLLEVEDEQRRLRWRQLGVTAGVLFALGVGVVIFGYHFPLPEERWPITWRSGASRAVFLGAGLAALWALGVIAERRRQVLLLATLLLVLGFDVLTHAPRQNPTAPRGVMEPGLITLQQLNPKPAHGRSRALLSPEADYRLRYSYASQPMNDYIVSRAGLFSNCNLLDQIPKVNGFYSLYPREIHDVVNAIYQSTNQSLPRLFDFLAVSQITRPGEVFEWTNRTSFLPMVTAGQRPVIADPPATLEALTQPGFDPRTVAYVPLAARELVQGVVPGAARVLTTEFSAHRSRIVVDASAPSMVVIAQSWYAPWRATVDGTPVPVWRANYAFQAVEVPAGTHELRLTYHDTMFVWGLVISGFTAMSCLWFWARHRSASRLEPAADHR